MFQNNPDLSITVDSPDTKGSAFSTENADTFAYQLSENYALISAQLDTFNNILNQTITAKDAAVTAQGLSEDAKDDSVTAQGLAEAAQAAAELAFDNFESIYLGAKSSAPSTDNNGGSLVNGMLYTNTTDAKIYVYVNSQWNQFGYQAIGEAEAARDAAIVARDAAITAQGAAEDAQGFAEDAQVLAETAEDNANDYASDAQKLAINAEDTQYTLSDGSTTGYSALHYSAKANADATSASGSALAAANSAVAAAAALDNFDDRYLGTKTSSPATDNDGDPLVAGALYYDSTEGAMYVYEGSTWIKTSSSLIDTWDEFVFTATAGQTQFTGVDDNGNTLSTSDYLIVTRNGLRLTETDGWTKTSNTVTLTSAAELDDIIVITTFSPVQLADILSLSVGGTVTGNVTFTGDVALNGTITGIDFSEVANKPTTLTGYGITDAATSAQGALADTALQPNDNISELTNDSDYTVDGTDVTFSSVQLTGGTGSQGTLSWNTDEETLDLILNGATLQLGQEVHLHVTLHGSAADISDGEAVVAVGSTGGSGKILVCKASVSEFNTCTGQSVTEIPAKFIIGVATEDISNNGSVTSFGKINDVPGASYTQGSVYYVDESTGGLTLTEPTSGLVMPIAFAINSDTLMVRTTPINELDITKGVTAYNWGDHSTQGYLTNFTETNDLTSAVTWANVPDTNITQSSVTQHQAALSITNTQVTGLGTASTQDVGTSAGNVVQLDGSGALPAVDGSNLTNVSSVATLNDLTDVDTTGVSNGETIVYNSTTSSFEPGVAGGGYFLGENGVVGTISSLGDIFRVHEDTLDTAVTIAANTNASANGPLTLNAAVTVNGTLTIV